MKMLRAVISWLVALCGLLAALGAVMLLDAETAFGEIRAPWARVAALVLLGFVPPLAVILAASSRKRSGLLLLCAAPVMGACAAAAGLPSGSLLETGETFLEGSLFFLLPAAFFIGTWQAGWPPLLSPRRWSGGKAGSPQGVTLTDIKAKW